MEKSQSGGLTVPIRKQIDAGTDTNYHKETFPTYKLHVCRPACWFRYLQQKHTPLITAIYRFWFSFLLWENCLSESISFYRPENADAPILISPVLPHWSTGTTHIVEVMRTPSTHILPLEARIPVLYHGLPRNLPGYLQHMSK